MLFYYADNPDIAVPAFAKCIDYLRNQKEFVPGKTEELGDGIRCIISAYETVDESQAFWEAHRRCVDVHCVIHGEERVSICSLAEAQVGLYHVERDYLEAKGIPVMNLKAKAGTVLCLFPNDVHQTRVQTSFDKNKRILKAIFKVPVELVKIEGIE